MRVAECTKPSDSVHMVTMIFIRKLRMSVLIVSEAGKKAMMPQ